MLNRIKFLNVAPVNFSSHSVNENFWEPIQAQMGLESCALAYGIVVYYILKEDEKIEWAIRPKSILHQLQQTIKNE